MSEPVVVLGNGPSRKQLILEDIPYDTIGGNGIVDEFIPTWLMYHDNKAMAEMEKRQHIPHQKPPIDEYRFGSCGGAMFHTACAMGYDPVYLVGFDGSGAGHACPNFGLRLTWKGPRNPAALDSTWIPGFRNVREMFPETKVYLLGSTPSYLDALFPRCGLEPWKK